MASRHTLLALLCTAAVLAPPLAASNANVVLESGVYKNLVLAVKRGTAQPTDGNAFVTNVQNFLQEGSEALNFATSGRASFGDVTLIIPRDWNESTLGVAVLPPIVTLAAADADILLHDEADTIPDTLQVEQCGVPGRQIRIPTSFLTLNAEDELVYGTKGRILTHEWAHYRWGAHDEHGFSADSVYGAGYGDSDRTPTSCAVNEMQGEWRANCGGGGSSCRPNTDGCLFCVAANATAVDTQASLGYLPVLSEGKFCDASTHNKQAPSPQNKLCGRRSVTELIDQHPDAANMMTNTPSVLSIVLRHEPLGRVVLLLDTPVPGQTGVLSNENLLTELEAPLMAYNNVLVAVMTYTDDGMGGAQVDVTRPFGLIEDGQYNDLLNALPTEANRGNVPKLSDVLTKVLEYLDSAGTYFPGTLLVMPVTNELVKESLLDETIGSMLRDRRIKPLLLFPEIRPSLATGGSFIQWSGSRFLYRNSTAEPENHAIMTAKAEVLAFLGKTFQNDHSIVRVDTVSLDQGQDFAYSVYYQLDVVQQRIAVITSSGPIGQVGVQYKRFGSFTDCLVTDICTVEGDAILYLLNETLTTPSPGEEWALQVTNKGAATDDITITWSEVTKVGKGEELEVQVWSSEGRGPVADIPQNQALSLYVSIMTYGHQVLNSRVSVTGTVEILPPGGASATPHDVTFEDNGVGTDLRKDDSVFSVSIALAEGSSFLPGTRVTVTELVIQGIGSDTPANAQASSWKGLRSDHSSHRRATGASKRPQSSALFTRDPAQVECCGSFVADPNIDFNHRIAGFNLLLRNAFEPIEIARTISYVEHTTTTTTTTSAPTTTTITRTTTTSESTTLTPEVNATKPSITTTKPLTTKPPSTTEVTSTTNSAVSIVAKGMLVLLSIALFHIFA